MSIQKVNHNVWKPWTGTDGSLAAVGAGDNKTSEWWDVGGWTDKRISWEVDSAGVIDFDMEMHISPEGYYELNNKTATTENYEVVTIVEAHTAAIVASKDSSDVDELQRPFRSMRLKISNDQAQAVTGTTVWVEGWS
jgi:hypothetical protein